MQLFLILLVVSALIGFFGRRRKMGFWGYFFASLALTPFIGILFLFASDPKKPVASKPQA